MSGDRVIVVIAREARPIWSDLDAATRAMVIGALNKSAHAKRTAARTLRNVLTGALDSLVRGANASTAVGREKLAAELDAQAVGFEAAAAELATVKEEG